MHVTHLAPAHPHPISTVLSPAPAGCGEVGWGAKEGDPGDAGASSPALPPLAQTAPPPQPKHRLATGRSRYITSPPPPAPARRPLPVPRGRPSLGEGTRLELSRALRRGAGQPRRAAPGTARPGTPPPWPPAHRRRSPTPQKRGGVGVTHAGHPRASTSTPTAPKLQEEGGPRPPPTPPAAAVTPRRPRLTHPRRRRPRPRETGREPRGPRGVRARRGGGRELGAVAVTCKGGGGGPAAARAVAEDGAGGRGEERGRLGGPPPSSSPPVLPPTPLSLWPPGSRCRRREGRRRAAGEGGREPAGRAAALKRAAAAAGGGRRRRRAGGGGAGRRRRRLYLGIGCRLQIRFITRKRRSGGGPGRAAGPRGGGCGPSVQSHGARDCGLSSPRGPGSRLPAPSFLPRGAAAEASCRRRRGACC